MRTTTMSGRPDLAILIGSSDAVVALRRQIDRLAASDGTVLVIGPAGSGRTLVATLLHQRGGRASRPCVTVNCGAAPRDRLDRTMFDDDEFLPTARVAGGGRGVGSTLVLDGIDALPAGRQVRLLRFLERHETERVGGTRPGGIRVVAAMTLDLAEAVAAGRFRADLFDRLAAITIALPSLAMRREDIPLLVDHFADREAGRGPRPRFAATALAYLGAQSWPGNVRELRDFVGRAAAAHPHVEIDDAMAAVLLHGERRTVDRWLDTSAAPLPLPNRRRPPPIVAADEVTDLRALLNDFEHAYLRDALGGTGRGAVPIPLFGVRDLTPGERRRRLDGSQATSARA